MPYATGSSRRLPSVAVDKVLFESWKGRGAALNFKKWKKKKGYNGKQQALNLKRKPIQNEVRSALANNCGYRN